MDELLKILYSTWTILGEMSIYLLFGFLMAGVLHVLIPQDFIEKHLRGRGIVKSIKAALIGVPMPLCSCGVIPVTASLKKHGAGKGATISFLTSTPQTGVDSIMITYGLLGWIFAVIRVITAFVSGIVCGTVTELLDKEEVQPETVFDNNCMKIGHKFIEVFRYGFIELPQDIGKALILGLIIAGVMTALIPQNFFAQHLGNVYISMLVMLLVGLPLYVCSTASVPVAAAFLQMGINPGAVLVFLITGPATNAATITVIAKVLNKKSAVIYLITIAACAIIAGVVLNLVFSPDASTLVHTKHFMIPLWIKHTGAVILILVLIISLLRRKAASSNLSVEGAILESPEKALLLNVEGMTCSRCIKTIKRALINYKNVESVDVSIKEGKVLVKGTKLDKSAISKTINSLGYEVGR